MLADYRWDSDHGLLVSFGEEVSPEAHRRVMGALAALRVARIPGVLDLHPAYASVLITFDPLAVPPERLEEEARRLLESAVLPEKQERRLVEIPVCYEPEFGPDLEEVARLHDLTVGELARIHGSADYTVSFLGFVPGFPYLAGMPERIATPRLPVPRRSVPPGSVAIGGTQTGIYPFATPGGWRIVGRTPLRIFGADREPPTLLAPGDGVRFVPISAGEFRALARD